VTYIVPQQIAQMREILSPLEHRQTMHLTAVAEQIRQLLISKWQKLINSEQGSRQKDARKAPTKPEINEEVRTQKGNPALLGDKKAVTFRTAEQYLGIEERQRQRLVVKGNLKVVGRGSTRLITTESLRQYLPPAENPP
jgi:hypothetical protein